MSDSSPERLSRIPALTPSSPKRRPLAQRSDSESNSANSSSIRLVSDEQTEVYSKSPFPTHPSQILVPRVSKLPPQRYAPFVDKDVHVSDENAPTNRSTTKLIKHEAPQSRPQQLRWPNRASVSTSISDADTSTLTATTLTTNETFLTTPSSSRQSSRTTPPSSPIEASYYEDSESHLEPVHEEPILESPKSTPAPRPTIRAVAPSESNERLPLNAKPSETSLTSAASVDTLPAPRPSLPSSGNFEVFPHSSSETSLHAGQARSLEPSPAPSIISKPIHEYASFESLLLDDTFNRTHADRPESASSPTGLGTHASSSSLVQPVVAIQYPVVEPPSTSSSWAEVSSPTLSTATPPTRSARMREDPYRSLQWGSRLSTIASESEQSHSHSTSTDSARRDRRRRTIGSLASGEPVNSLSDVRSSEWEYGSGVLTGTESNISIPIPQPLFSPRPLPSVPDERGSGRDSDEREDILGELQSPHLRPQRSGILTRFSSKSSLRPSSSDSAKSRSSQISFIGELMWARRYYSNGEPTNMIARNNSFLSESSSTSRLHTATSGIANSAVTSSPVSDTVPTSIWRPRNRPHNSADQPDRRLRQETRRINRTQQRRHSIAITEETEMSDGQPGQRRRSLSAPDLTVHEMMWSPRLRRDRRQTQRYSAWAAPSFDEPFGKTIFGPTNRQIFCFALGFILPPAWWLAAFLPLPQRPDLESVPDMSELDVHNPIPNANMSEFSLEEKRWQKAQWWRRINRILSLFGILLVAAIIALAIIGTRKNGFTSGNSRAPITVPTSVS